MSISFEQESAGKQTSQADEHSLPALREDRISQEVRLYSMKIKKHKHENSLMSEGIAGGASNQRNQALIMHNHTMDESSQASAPAFPQKPKAAAVLVEQRNTAA